MKLQKFILTMATLLIAGSAVAAGLDSRNTPVFTPGSTEDVQIKADLPQGTSALQFTVTVPEAFELGNESLKLNAQVASRSHNEGNGVYNFVIYTEDNSAIKSDADWLFGLTLKAKTSVEKGEYTLKFTNIIVAASSGSETVISDCNVALKVRIPVSQVTVSPSAGSILIGESLHLTATVLPSEAEQGINWKSDDPDIASVDASGNVRGTSVGSTRITARSTDNTEIFGFCNVTVNPVMVAAILLDKTSLELRAGDLATLKATVSPGNATNSKVKWTSSDRSIVTVDDNGNVVAMKAGSATITAAATDGSNLSAACKVTVLPPLASAVTLSKSELGLTVMETFTLTTSVTPSDAAQEVSWNSSDEGIATVDANGTVKAVASGAAMIIATAADGSGVSGSCKVTVADAKVSSITLSKTALGLRIGQSETITATVLPEYTANRDVIWSSGNPSVAAVDVDGTVTAVSLGDAVITATAADGSGVAATCAVTVTNALATWISIDRSTATIYMNESLRLVATVTPAGAAGSVNWSTDMPEVATVDKDGNVNAHNPGSAIITATTADGTNLSATCAVTVVRPMATAVTLSKSELGLTVMETFTLTASVTPSDAAQEVSWSSSDERIATVDAKGTVKAVASGVAMIIATAADGSGVSGSCKVTVADAKVSSITLSKTALGLRIGQSETITATVLPEYAANRDVIWSSGNPSVAAVDVDGTVTAVSLGDAVITATAADGSGVTATCNVTVVAIPVESLVISPESWDGIEGESFTITATVLPEDATDKSLYWDSSAQDIATVDQDGNVSLLKVGNCMIRVVTLDGSNLSAECIVTSRSGIEEIFADPDVKVDIYSISGKLLNHNCSLEEVKNLESGLYIIQSGRVSKTILIH